MKNVLLIGENPNGPTGNGLMMLSICSQIDITAHNLSVFCPCSDYAPNLSIPNVVRLIPSDDVKRNDIWGSQKLLTLLDTNQLDFVVMVGIDVWRYVDIIVKIKQIQQRRNFRLIHIFPYDLQYLDKEFIQYANMIDVPCVYSEYGYNILKDHVPNLQYFRPPMYQKELFFPYEDERRLSARQSLFPTVGDDAFVFGVIGPNQIRKDPQKVIKAFSLLKNSVSDRCILYMHTNFKDGVYNLQNYAQSCGLTSGDLLVKPEGAFSPFERMPDIYNSLDCLVNCSLQEGLSWTVLQALLCGLPVVMSDSTAHTELFSEHTVGDLIPCFNETYLPVKTLQGHRWIDALSCSAKDIAAGMKFVVEKKFERNRHKQGQHEWTLDWFKQSSSIRDLLKNPSIKVSTPLIEAILFMQHSSAGDILMTTRCLKRIREKHPNLPLHYMTQDKFAGILDRNPNVDKMLPWNPELRKAYQVVYNPHGEHILRGGFNNLDIKLTDMYPYFCKVTPDDFFIHCEDVMKKVSDLKTPLNDFKGIAGNGLPYIVVHTTGGDPQYRTYPHMGMVVKGLILPVVQIGSTSDLYCPGAIDLRGILSFTETAWVMKHAKAAIVIDSFPSHLAGAVGTPCIVLYGPAPARVVGPIHPNVPDTLWFDMEPNKLDVCPNMTNCHGTNRNCQSPCIHSINPLLVRQNLISILSQVVE